MAELSEVRKALAYYLTRPVIRFVAKAPVTPDAISWFGFSLTFAAAALVFTGHLFAAGFVVLVAGFCDILDGALARHINRVTRSGAVLDSILDRLSESVLLLGILVLYAREQSVAGILVVGLAIIGSLMVSYIRARAEALGLECQVGLFTRAERVVVLALGLLLYQVAANALIITLVIIVVFSFITLIQRLVYAQRQMKD